MDINKQWEDLAKEFMRDCGKLEAENKKLLEENRQLKIALSRTRDRLNDLQQQSKTNNGMDSYVAGIRNGTFKPRLNTAINEKVLLRTILKLKTTNIEEIANALNTSYSTVRRRLIQYKLYPIDLDKIREHYILFYSEGD